MTDVNTTGESTSRELISALADGQLRGHSLDEASKLASGDPEGRSTWMTYHLIGDALRSQELAQTVCSSAFMSKLSARLAETAIEPAISVNMTEVAPAYSADTAEAANDKVFRWKMVAGVATLATVAVLAWSGISSPSQSTQLALAPENSKIVTADASADVRPGAQQTSNGVMIRDPRLDELLAAHRQAGGASALQMPSGFLRNATFDGPNR